MTTEIKALIALLVLSAFVGYTAVVGWWFYADGVGTERARWTKKDRDDTAAAANQIVEHEAARRKQRTDYEVNIVALTGIYENKLKEKDREATALLARVRTGSQRLFIDAKCPDSGAVMPGPSTTNSDTDVAGRAELSGQAAEFLISEAARANKITEKLTALQTEHSALFKFCKG